MKDDPEPNPFAFQYDPSGCLKKRTSGDEADTSDNDDEALAAVVTTVTNAQLTAIVELAISKNLEPLKVVLRDYQKTFVKDVAKEVASILLEQAPQENYYDIDEDVHDAEGPMDAVANTPEGIPNTPLIHLVWMTLWRILLFMPLRHPTRLSR